MRQKLLVIMVGAAWLGAIGCGSDRATAPAPAGDGPTLARQFEELADSVAEAGDSTTSNVLHHAAEIVRLTGHATPVTVTIDGETRGFIAVAEQLDFPNLQCRWPGDSGIAPPGDTITVPPTHPDTGTVNPDSATVNPDSGTARPLGLGMASDPGECTVVDTTSMRTLIAWEPERMAEVVRIVATPGRNLVEPGVPAVMSALPTTPASGDTAGGGGGGGGGIGPGGGPGFFGEYLVREVGSWYAADGNQSNDLEARGGACTAERATFDWAEFECETARFRFAFDMRAEPLRYEALAHWAPGAGPTPNGAEGTHRLALVPSRVDGVRLTVAAWTPPPLPPPGPGPVPLRRLGPVTALSGGFLHAHVDGGRGDRAGQSQSGAAGPLSPVHSRSERRAVDGEDRPDSVAQDDGEAFSMTTSSSSGARRRHSRFRSSISVARNSPRKPSVVTSKAGRSFFAAVLE